MQGRAGYLVDVEAKSKDKGSSSRLSTSCKIDYMDIFFGYFKWQGKDRLGGGERVRAYELAARPIRARPSWIHRSSVHGMQSHDVKLMWRAA